MQPQQQPYMPTQPPVQPPRKKRDRGTYFTWAMIACGAVLAVALVAWLVIVLMGKTTSDSGKVQAGVAALLEPAAVAPKVRTINSQLGVQIPYDSRELEGFGFADEVTFADTDLDEARAYTVMRIRPVETSQATRSQVALESPELRVTSSVNEAYWEQLATKKEYKDLSKIDMLVKETVAARMQNKATKSSDAEVKKISDVDYRKVVFTTIDERYGVTTERREDCYVTVQNDRPYVACINGIRDANFAALPAIEQVVSEITYGDLDKSILARAESDAAKKDTKLLSAQDDERQDATKSVSGTEAPKVSKDSSGAEKPQEGDVETKEPEVASSSDKQSPQEVAEYLSDTKSFVAFATGAPATVRIGTIYCADLKLALPDGIGEGPALAGACADKAGTGFFVSREGIVATSASNVQVKPQDAITAYIVNATTSSQALQRLQRVLDYMVEGRVLMQTDADALRAGVEERNPEMVAKVHALSSRISPEDIAVTQEEYRYAVQLADKPISVTESGDGSDAFAFTDTVLEAVLEGKAYSSGVTQKQIYQGDAVGGDTAILKLKKSGTYPALRLGMSGEGSADGSIVNIVGLPMYAVGSLGTAQFGTLPAYRSGKVTQTFAGEAGQKVRMIDTSSRAGFAGAPALDQSGHVVGVATYGNLNCQGGQCFSSTVIRDTVGISEVAKQRNITLQPLSAATDTWNNALSQLVRGNYREATALFDQAGQIFPQNYLAAQFSAYSKSQYDSAADTSTVNSLVGVVQIVALLSACLLLLLAITRLALKLFTKPYTETQYGQIAHGEYIDPKQWQRQSVAPEPSQQPPVPLGEVPQPTQWQQSTGPAPVQSQYTEAQPVQTSPQEQVGPTPPRSVPPQQ